MQLANLATQVASQLHVLMIPFPGELPRHLCCHPQSANKTKSVNKSFMVRNSQLKLQIPGFRGIFIFFLGLLPIIQLKLATNTDSYKMFDLYFQLASQVAIWSGSYPIIVFDLTMSFIFAVLHIFYFLDPLQLDLCACIFSIFLSVMILCQIEVSVIIPPFSCVTRKLPCANSLSLSAEIAGKIQI